MLERRLIDYFKNVDGPHSRDVRAIKAVVESGVRLEEGLEDRASYEVIDGMLTEISIAMYHTGNVLKSSTLPKFGLTYPWGGESSSSQSTDEISVLAEAVVDYHHPWGLISFSPSYLEAIADFKMGSQDPQALTRGFEDPLPKITAHENYHLSQYFRFPKTMDREVCGVATAQDLSKWNRTRPELAARRFEDKYIIASIFRGDIGNITRA